MRLLTPVLTMESASKVTLRRPNTQPRVDSPVRQVKTKLRQQYETLLKSKCLFMHSGSYEPELKALFTLGRKSKKLPRLVMKNKIQNTKI